MAGMVDHALMIGLYILTRLLGLRFSSPAPRAVEPIRPPDLMAIFSELAWILILGQRPKAACRSEQK
jgi:hypothetical protein